MKFPYLSSQPLKLAYYNILLLLREYLFSVGFVDLPVTGFYLVSSQPLKLAYYNILLLLREDLFSVGFVDLPVKGFYLVACAI